MIDADEITRQVQKPGGAAYDEIVREFGQGILASDGTIDRRKLGQLVFNDYHKLQRLNEIVHPKVRTEELRLLELYRQRPLVVFMVPLLFENGLERLVDAVMVVVTRDDIRRQRLRQRNGWSDAEIDRRLAAQWPDEKKMSLADFVIDNSGSLEATREQVRAVLDKLSVLGSGERSDK